MTKPTPSEPQDDDAIPVGRLAAWGVLAVVLVLGLFLYFRYQPGIAPLYDKVH